MKIEVGKTYELNDGSVAKCVRMDGDDPLAVGYYGFGPFFLKGFGLYRQDGRHGDGSCPKLDVKREVITLQGGKYYRTRGGRKVGPVEAHGRGTKWPWSVPQIGVTYKDDGTHWADGSESEHDLIAEWTEPTRDPELTSPYGDNNHPLPDVTPETGTLAELKVKPGDVVECVLSAFGGANFIDGKYYVASGTGVITDEVGNKYLNGNPDSVSTFRIISRASDQVMHCAECTCDEGGDNCNWIASDTPKTWGEMTDAEKGALLLAEHDGEQVQIYIKSGWLDVTTDRSEVFVDNRSYRIKPEPKRETVTLMWCNEKGDGGKFGTINMIEGKPDLDSIKMEVI